MNKIIAVDFDGTCVKHEFPEIGGEIPHAVRVLRRLDLAGVKIILWTMRSGEYLSEAVAWFAENEIRLWGINENPDQDVSKWSTSPKAYAHLYIDDAALGCPLVYSTEDEDYRDERPYVDWLEVERSLSERGFLKGFAKL